MGDCHFSYITKLGEKKPWLLHIKLLYFHIFASKENFFKFGPLFLTYKNCHHITHTSSMKANKGHHQIAKKSQN
jgi:hypothetical protein